MRYESREEVEEILKKGSNRYAFSSGLTREWISFQEDDLSGLDLSGLDFSGLNMDFSDMSNVNLNGTIMTGARLLGVKLEGTDLASANLAPIKEDLWSVLRLASRSEVLGLRSRIADGRIAGRYYVGECACLIGTIAILRGCEYHEIPGLLPDFSRPIETWFMSIRVGDTPERSQFSRLALQWVDEWLGDEDPEGGGL